MQARVPPNLWNAISAGIKNEPEIIVADFDSKTYFFRNLNDSLEHVSYQML